MWIYYWKTMHRSHFNIKNVNVKITKYPTTQLENEEKLQIENKEIKKGNLIIYLGPIL